MATSFLRTTVRARTGGSGTTTGVFIPESTVLSGSPTMRIFPGTAEMSVVVLAKLRTGGSAAAVADDPFETCFGPAAGPVDAGGWVIGYDRVSVSPPEVYLGMVDATGAFQFGESRGIVPADENKVHRFVGVGSVAAQTISMYTNGGLSGIQDTLPSFTPAPMTGGSPDSVGVIGLQDQSSGIAGGGQTQWEVMDIAVVANRAFTAAEVAALDVLIRSTGHVPEDFADWEEFYKAEWLANGHAKVWGLGGRAAGRGWPALNGVEPILGSMLIGPNAWGGSGT